MTVIVDSADLSLIQTAGPQGASGPSRALYEWLGISNEKDFPARVKHAITTETSAVLHQYTREGFTNHGATSVIHVTGPDFRGQPGATCVEFVSKLTQAYTNVFTIFSETGVQSFRIQPISGGTLSGCFLYTHPMLTADAVHTA